MHIENPELNDVQNLFLYCDCELMDENISVMNKYSELYYAAVRRLVCKAQQTVCQHLFTI